MLVENLGSVTFVNGILRVQCTTVDSEGKIRESGTLEIPGNSINNVINGLINSSKSIEEKLNTVDADGKSSTDDKKDKKKNSKKK
jgi:hypothetical protein